AAGGVRDLVFSEPLRLSEGARRVQVVDAATGDQFTIYSRAADAKGDEWTRHASGRRVAASAERPVQRSFAEVRGRCEGACEPAQLYSSFAERGLAFGASFQGVAGAWFAGDEAVARIAAPDALLDDLGRYRFHPAILDACIQPCTRLLAGETTGLAADEVFLPFAIDSFDLWTAPVQGMWSHVRLRPAEGGEQVRIADIDVRDADGHAVASLGGLRLRRTRLAAMCAPGLARLYSETWESASTGSALRTLVGTRWLLHAAAADSATALAGRLAGAGATSVVLEGD